MDFEKRLEKAISRGTQTRANEERQSATREMSEEQFRAEHSRVRLEVSDHIEACLRKLADYFPGFRFETIVGEEGWGARVSRDDFAPGGGRTPANAYSRMEVLIRPFSPTHIIELVGKGTIRNKEMFRRNHYQFLTQLDEQSLRDMIDLWVLEYAETYAARKG